MSEKVVSAPDTALLSTTLITLTQTNNIKRIKDFLEAYPNLPITKIKDVRLYTVLHMACLSNQLEICRLFLTYAPTTGASRNEIKDWVNGGTDEGFAAIHFASFKGNIKLIKLLEEAGANINAKNSKGLGVLHIAAQGDQPVSLAYFVDKGLSLQDKDFNGSTPLHWASYFGMENATQYLTAWGCSPNELDFEFQCTPLHLAVNSGNFKVVKKLLSKGADKTIKNKEGKLPLDLAVENEYESIMTLLQNKNQAFQCLSVKSSISKTRSRRLLIFFVFSYIIIGVFTALFLFPYVSSRAWIYVASVLLTVSLATFLFVWLSNPGYVSNKEKGNILKLLMNYDPHLVCPECVIVKPDRSKHCEHCKSCVCVYDHHCPWVDNCIGAKNYAYFVTFIILIMLTLICLVVLAGLHVGNSVDTPQWNDYANILISHSETLFILKEITCIIIFVMAICFLLPLFGLNLVHLNNLRTGQTTNERFRFGGTEKAGSRKSSSRMSVVDQSFMKAKPKVAKSSGFSLYYYNCISMCCTNAKNLKYVYSGEQL